MEPPANAPDAPAPAAAEEIPAQPSRMAVLGKALGDLLKNIFSAIVFLVVTVPRKIAGVVVKILTSPTTAKIVAPFAQYAALAAVIILAVMWSQGKLGSGARRRAEERARAEQEESASKWEMDMNSGMLEVDSDGWSTATGSQAYAEERRLTLWERFVLFLGMRPSSFKNSPRPYEFAGGRCGGEHRLLSDSRTCGRPRRA